MILLLENMHPSGFGISGVAMPFRPPCFAIPIFEPAWFPNRFPTSNPRTAYVQDVCNDQVTTFAECLVDEDTTFIEASKIKSLCFDSGDFKLPHSARKDTFFPMLMTGSQRLFAFAESEQEVILGHEEPLRTRLKAFLQRTPVSQMQDLQSENQSEAGTFRLLEAARFCKDRVACLELIQVTFNILQRHNRTLAVIWMEMTKAKLKHEDILESTD